MIIHIQVFKKLNSGILSPPAPSQSKSCKFPISWVYVQVAQLKVMTAHENVIVRLLWTGRHEFNSRRFIFPQDFASTKIIES